jgi:hypothetical protein
MQPLNDSSNLQQSLDALRAAKRPRLSQLEPAAATFLTIVRRQTTAAVVAVRNVARNGLPDVGTTVLDAV